MTVTTILREESATYTRHDQLFKELINNFFEEFLEAFFPDVYGHIDFSSVQPLPDEVYTDLLEGKTRRLDIIVETKLKGEDTVMIIHVEPQSYYQSDFRERMYHYFSLLYNKYRKPILPIAVFSYDEKRYEENEFTIGFPFFHVMTFNFLMLELKKKNWREYIETDNPAAAALLSKMGYTEEERVQVRIEFLRMITRMELDPARTRLILGFFERYLKLNEQEEEEVMEKVKKMDESEEILDLPISWEEKGKIQEKRNIAIEMLKEGIPIEMISKITHLDKDEIEKMRKTLN